jgi:hypothetical protein
MKNNCNQLQKGNQMNQEETLSWLDLLMGFMFWMVVVCFSILATGFISGYLTERFAIEIHERNVRCINSACDGTQCKHRFVRHQGCGDTK